MHREEPEVSDIAREGLESLGVEVLTDVEVVRVHEEGKKQVTVRVGRKLETFSASEILLATGKTANTGGLGCKAAGVNLDQYGTVKVNKELRTTTPHIWAAGDVSGGMQFTHTAHYEGNIAGHNAFSKKPWMKYHGCCNRTVLLLYCCCLNSMIGPKHNKQDFLYLHKHFKKTFTDRPMGYGFIENSVPHCRLRIVVYTNNGLNSNEKSSPLNNQDYKCQQNESHRYCNQLKNNN